MRAEVSLSQREACDGHVVPLDVRCARTCPYCGGRGETWTEPCGLCRGTGESLVHHVVRVTVPAGVADGAASALPRESARRAVRARRSPRRDRPAA